MTIEGLVIRRADVDDVIPLAEAHLDSIRSIGAAFYDPPAVHAWQAGICAELYRNAMEEGETFFIATRQLDGHSIVLGFASDYPIEGPVHGTSVYVRGSAARQGLGSALLRHAEGHALTRGAASIQIEASFAGVEFYKANGYEEVSRGETRLSSGHVIGCVFMRKRLAGG